MAIICDLCRRDPMVEEKSEALKAQPWALAVTPPPGSGLPERRLCWECFFLVFESWVKSVGFEPPKKVQK